jgi:hypothetical protein
MHHSTLPCKKYGKYNKVIEVNTYQYIVAHVVTHINAQRTKTFLKNFLTLKFIYLWNVTM